MEQNPSQIVEKKGNVFLAAVDFSKPHLAENAVEEALARMRKENDHLLIVAITERITHKHAHSPGLYKTLSSFQLELEQGTKKNMQALTKYVLSKGYKVTPIVAVSSHVGEMICKIAEKRNVDMIIVVRRSMNTVSRLFIGSTSRYVVEHANCNVLVAKEKSEEEVQFRKMMEDQTNLDQPIEIETHPDL